MLFQGSVYPCFSGVSSKAIALLNLSNSHALAVITPLAGNSND